MSTQLQDRIVRNLIQSAPVRLKASTPIRQETNGPTLCFYTLACLDCEKQMQVRPIRLSFHQGQEEKWGSDAQTKVEQHLSQFHS